MENIAIHIITCKEQEYIQAIIDSGALEVKNGSATLHFDKNGTLQNIEIKHIAWKFDKDINMPYND